MFAKHGTKLRLLREQKERDEKFVGVRVVETHPALAIAIKGGFERWYREKDTQEERETKRREVARKGKGKSSRTMYQAAQEYLDSVPSIWGREFTFSSPPPLTGKIGGDDYIDALVAMMLGVQWLRRNGAEIYGFPGEGSFLLPKVDKAVDKAWSDANLPLKPRKP